MTASDLNSSLPPQARKRIKKLETTVSELTDALDQIVWEMRRHGVGFTTETARTRLLKTILARNMPSKRPQMSKSIEVIQVNADPCAPETGLVASMARGEAAKVQWVQSGEVVPAKVLADKWGLTPQALGPAADRGEVFAIVVKRQRYYPKEFLDLDRDAVGAVSKALNGLSPEEKLIFWKRPHGVLGGKNVRETLSAKNGGTQIERVIQLAQTWANDGRDRINVAAIS